MGPKIVLQEYTNICYDKKQIPILNPSIEEIVLVISEGNVIWIKSYRS